MDLDLETRQKICQLVAGLIISDDILDAKEEAFIDRLIESFGIEGGRDVVFPLVDDEEAATQLKELPRGAQDQAFELLLEAACVDGQIVPEERTYLGTLAGALGITDADLDARLAKRLKG
jgi:uncharacterized tellurite resistance protein B-like protein